MMVKEGSQYYNYKYNADGIRIRKNANGITYTYFLDDSGNLIGEKRVGPGVNLRLTYEYDATGILAFGFSDTITGQRGKLYYQKNLQGDIIGINWASGVTACIYDYDAWGNVILKSGDQYILSLNRILYRGYYQDIETGWYYLQSRYYDPSICRFINADGIDYLDTESLTGLNLYTYCENNPIMFSDSYGQSPEGRKWWQNILIGLGIIVGAAIIGAAIAVSFGAATPFFTIVGTSIVGGLKIAAAAGATAGLIRAGTTAFGGGSLADVGKSFVTGFADGFYAGSIYAGTNMILSPIAMGISGAFRKGYGWVAGKWIGGYQTPKTPGVSLLVHLGGINGGRTFGLDMDMYNGLHVHSKRLGGIKNHNWWMAPAAIGIGVGFSSPWSVW